MGDFKRPDGLTCDWRRVFDVVVALRGRFSGLPTAIRRILVDVIPDKRITDTDERAWRRSRQNLAQNKILIKIYYSRMATVDHNLTVDRPGYRFNENHRRYHKTFPCLSVVKNRVFFYILCVLGYSMQLYGRFLDISLTDIRFTI